MGEIWLFLYALSAGTTDQLGEVGVGRGRTGPHSREFLVESQQCRHSFSSLGEPKRALRCLGTDFFPWCWSPSQLTP